jgi:hypothetical protein
MNQNQHTIINRINILPAEMKRYIKSYLPISVLKTVRKIQPHEIPMSYRICKDVHDHFYKKYIGYDVDISSCKWRISMIRCKMRQNKYLFCISDFCKPFDCDNMTFMKSIKEYETDIQLYTFLREHFFQYYQQSTIHLNNYKIIEE